MIYSSFAVQINLANLCNFMFTQRIAFIRLSRCFILSPFCTGIYQGSGWRCQKSCSWNACGYLECEAYRYFVNSSSCLSNRRSNRDEVNDLFDKQKMVDMVCLGFSKVFDSVNRRLFIVKLDTFKISRELQSWLKDALTSRLLIVGVSKRNFACRSIKLRSQTTRFFRK